MKENGLQIIGMVMEFKHGLMVQDIKVNGKIIRHMGKAFLDMLMEMNIMENGKTIRLTDMGYMCI